MLPNPQPPFEWPITGELDLHLFQPREIKSLVLEYLAECQAKGIFEVRIIHGKGQGVLQRTVHSLLARHPEVVRYAPASEYFGGLGATMVRLRQPEA